jgi:hypothetical protein
MVVRKIASSWIAEKGGKSDRGLRKDYGKIESWKGRRYENLIDYFT